MAEQGFEGSMGGKDEEEGMDGVATRQQWWGSGEMLITLKSVSKPL